MTVAFEEGVERFLKMQTAVEHIFDLLCRLLHGSLIPLKAPHCRGCASEWEAAAFPAIHLVEEVVR